uniref:Uncharacterized protein n=1 Tax=Amphimedon queenslandica TaxID=400682 RepID=A0A1X7SI27_AMPQE
TTPRSVTGQPPSVLLNNRSLKTVLDLLKPDINRRVQDRQEVQKRAYDHHAQERGEFEINDFVMVRIHRDNHQYWEPGIITEKISLVSFVVKLEDGTRCHCHIDQLCKRFSSSRDSSNGTPDTSQPHSSKELESEQDEESQFKIVSQEQPPPESHDNPIVNPPPSRRYPIRDRRLPDRFF